MINSFKIFFKNNIDYNNFTTIKKKGTKIYFNRIKSVNIKNFNKFVRYICGYIYTINLRNFNVFTVKLFILNKNTKKYVKFLNYINLFTNLIFIKENEI